MSEPASSIFPATSKSNLSNKNPTEGDSNPNILSKTRPNSLTENTFASKLRKKPVISKIQNHTKPNQINIDTNNEKTEERHISKSQSTYKESKIYTVTNTLNNENNVN